ncbi:MAG TPA: hypothetical protein VI685_00125 [Candidatus Angelobacter sp.]
MGFVELPLELFSLEKRPPGCRAAFVFYLEMLSAESTAAQDKELRVGQKNDCGATPLRKGLAAM